LQRYFANPYLVKAPTPQPFLNRAELPAWHFTYISLNSKAVSSHYVAPLSPQVV